MRYSSLMLSNFCLRTAPSATVIAPVSRIKLRWISKRRTTGYYNSRRLSSPNFCQFVCQLKSRLTRRGPRRYARVGKFPQFIPNIVTVSQERCKLRTLRKVKPLLNFFNCNRILLNPVCRDDVLQVVHAYCKEGTLGCFAFYFGLEW